MANILSKFDLSGKTAVVTGGARGLCYGIAEALRDAGASVALIDILDCVERSAQALSTEKAPAYGVRGDMSDADDIARAFEEALQKLGGRMDILVNGAGIQYRCASVDFPKDMWDKVVGIDLSAVFFMCQHAGKVMLEQKYGKIINIASMNSFFGGTIVPAYAASKGGVAQLTKALSNEWAGEGITVNAIAPGYMVSEMSKTMREVPGQVDELTKRIPAGRWGTPEDLKGLAVFLASDASEYLSGTVIPVDGGFMGR